MAAFGKMTMECPVCRGPWDVRITGQMMQRQGKPGQARTIVKVAKPLRIPREHRNCIAKVD